MAIVPAVDDGRQRSSEETLWCLSRRGDFYDELLLVSRPSRSTTAFSALTVPFRGSFDAAVESRVGSHGRRNFTMLPKEDVRLFVAGSDALRSNGDVVSHFLLLFWVVNML